MALVVVMFGVVRMMWQAVDAKDSITMVAETMLLVLVLMAEMKL